MFMTAGLGLVFWFLTRGQAARGRSEDRSFEAEYTRGLAELSGLLVMWTATMGVVLLLAASIGLSNPVAWGVAFLALVGELPLVRWIGMRYPMTRLPTSWRPPRTPSS